MNFDLHLLDQTLGMATSFAWLPLMARTALDEVVSRLPWSVSSEPGISIYPVEFLEDHLPVRLNAHVGLKEEEDHLREVLCQEWVSLRTEAPYLRAK